MKTANEIKNMKPEEIKKIAEKFCYKCKSLGICEQDGIWRNCQKIR